MVILKISLNLVLNHIRDTIVDYLENKTLLKYCIWVFPINLIVIPTLFSGRIELLTKLKNDTNKFIIHEDSYFIGFGYVIGDITYVVVKFIWVLPPHISSVLTTFCAQITCRNFTSDKISIFNLRH